MLSTDFILTFETGNIYILNTIYYYYNIYDIIINYINFI